ncbi:methyltransferase domain-containing protein [Xanthomonas sp. WHRI 10064A]|uniref:methyltransferase domain-containing protein n=1 Tax=unclassified Xanthomonas TaxID=2643310 RepID=UPI002B232DE8|nr:MULTISPECIES: methyltransferase domain-containing protein [unclassified Xanthomonas]MEA9587220.1 methyltransferase domain-containing protein [Xanthomonas sp. WHRI 10064B]MEA9616411.1 methyltransferase domain-containing protein [Xanthomonas sp. WHRI 10064A]
MDIYDNGFSDDNVYGHIAKLLARFDPEPGDLFLDFGCGFGRLAEVVSSRHGLTYVGFDINEPGLESLRARGFDSHFLNLLEGEQAEALIRSVVPQGKRIAAICIIDTLEHLADPLSAVELLGKIAREKNTPLLVSVPNVAHADIAAKLVAGHFDYTEAGLLDHTHMQYFTNARFGALLECSGWHEVHRKDVLMVRSDQHFPAQLPTLSTHAPLSMLLAGLRRQADDYGNVNQFVRAFLPGPEPTRPRVLPYATGKDELNRPFLSVVIRTVGKRISTLRESLLCLSAQTSQDFEIVIAGHKLDIDRQIAVEAVIEELQDTLRKRTRLIRVEEGGRSAPLNQGFLAARGRYVAAFDDDDLVFGDWVETFATLEKGHAGQLLRATAIAQDWDRVRRSDGTAASRAISGMRALYPPRFELLAHIVENRTPLHSIAFPRVLFSDMGYRFDERLSTAEDWDLIIRVAPLCGVACASNITAMYRLWKDGDSSANHHDAFEWKSNYLSTLRKLDDAPLLLPPGSATRLRRMFLDLERLQGFVSFDPDSTVLADPPLDDRDRLEALRERYHQLTHSRSWRITAPLRAAMRRIRRLHRYSEPKVWMMSERDLEYQINQILSSSSWRWTQLLRMAGRR